MARPGRGNRELIVIYWRDIPAQVNAQEGRDRHQVRVLEITGVHPFRARLVHRDQVGEHQLVAGREQVLGDMAADMAGGPRDQDPHQPFTAPTRPLTK